MSETQSQFELEEAYIDAVMDGQFDEAEAILNNPDFVPSQHCLSETIYQDCMPLVRRLLSLVEPDDACLAYAIMNQRHSLVRTILARDIEVTIASLQYAISACNIKMVKYLLYTRNVDISTELLWDLEDDPQPKDNFSPEIRLRRNKIIKAMLNRSLLKEGITQEEIDAELVL
jgi:hypothetical protein